jgi:cytochrome c2
VFEEGGANRVGPNLYGVAGREVAAVEGFAYSSALKEYGGEWTYERLDCFLKNPKECVPGTSMAYSGIKDPAKRADMIAYLASLGDAPPFPEPEAEAQEAAAQPAEESAEATQAAGEQAEEQAQQPAEPAQETAASDAAAPAESEQAAAQDAQPAETQDKAGEEAQKTAAASEEAVQTAASEQDGAADEASEGKSELAALLASGDAAQGEKAVRVCSACHTFDEGGPNRVGPNLYGVVGREVASVESFNYSQALKDYSGEWTYERLDCYLKNPKECVPGNKMTYAGVKDDAKRADIIAYLASLGDAPQMPGSKQDTGQADQPGSETRSASVQPSRQ